MTDGSTFYEAVGGRDTFVRLVDRFYDGVATDPVMRGMYPAELGPARERMTAFLAQYWGRALRLQRGPWASPAADAARALPDGRRHPATGGCDTCGSPNGRGSFRRLRAFL